MPRTRRPYRDPIYQYDFDDSESVGTASDGEPDESQVIDDFRNEIDDDETIDSQSECDGDDEELTEEELLHETDVQQLVRVLKVPDEITSKSGFAWRGTSPKRSTRIPARNIVLHAPGNKAESKGITDELQLWELFFPKELIDLIVKCTNEKIDEEVAKSKAAGSKDVTYKGHTNPTELRALIGLFYVAGALHQNRTHARDLFSAKYGLPYFRATMPEQRFVFLSACLRFDRKSTRDERIKTDKLAAVRDMWDHVIETSKRLYTPSDCVTVDEQLLGFHGRCGFKMYIPNKPDKFGMKIVTMNDAKSWYMINAEMYTGKTTSTRNQPLAEKYLLELSEPIHGSNRTIICDNWFTSIGAAQKLLNKKLTMVGTIRKNKREIPALFKETKTRDKNTAMFAYHDELTLLSYCPNKKKKKTVLLLSTTHDLPDQDQSVTRPEIVEYYNQNKSGVDVFDRLCKNYSTARNSRRWTATVFYGLLNASGVNSFVLWKNNIDDENERKKKREKGNCRQRGQSAEGVREKEIQIPHEKSFCDD